jgi:hypothetical protein
MKQWETENIDKISVTSYLLTIKQLAPQPVVGQSADSL